MKEKSMQSLGGKARAKALTSEERSEIAMKAVAKRWGIPKATFGASDRPLRIGNIEIPCYVLEDGRRVLVQNAMINALGMARGGSGRGYGDRLAYFVAQDTLKPFVSNGLRSVTETPFKFITTNGKVAYGYEAETLAEICFAVLDAEKSGKLLKQQQHIALRCRILVKGFAVVGINALVDEATGYQEIRDRLALQKILEKFISKELQKWAKRFPDDFYREMFRLKNWQWEGMNVQRPQVIGHYTNDVVYQRIAPGVLKELRELNPPDDTGHRKHRHHQWLTPDVGHPRLRDHLNGIIALMKASHNWAEFQRMVNRVYPKMNTTIELDLEI